MKKDKRKMYLKLILKFMKIGAFTFGGGYAMIPLIKREIAEKEKWLAQEEIIDIIGISEATPGSIGINLATFTGQKMAGIPGSICATIGVVIPSFLIIVLLSFGMKQVEHMKIIQDAFYGIRIGVLALILNALLSVLKHCPKSTVSWFIMTGVFAAVAFCNVNVVAVIVLCAVLGVFLPNSAFEKKEKKYDICSTFYRIF